MPSLSGTTRESVEALGYCKERGAKVIALTGHADTPLARDADHAFVNFAEDDTSCESFYLQSLLVALSLLDARGDWPTMTGSSSSSRSLPALLLEVKRAGFEPRAAELAAHTAGRRLPHHHRCRLDVAEAWYYGMCILEEMQWIRTRPVHASDFFHGTLELVGAASASCC